MEFLRVLGPLLLGATVALVAAAVTTGSRAQRAFGVALGVLAMVPVWLVPPEHTVFRALWTIGAFAGAMRSVDLGRVRWSLGDRLKHVLSVVDTRRLVQAPRALVGVALLHAVLWEVAAVPAYFAVGGVGHPASPRDWIARWVYGLLFVYAMTAGAYPFLYFVYRAIGFITPPLHIAPVAARSVQEFWGERWNRTVSAWLADTFFRPLARRRMPILGAFAAFAASAAVHAYVAWVAVGSAMAVWMLFFFMSQALLIVLERAIAVRSWSAWAGHAWTIAWMVALSPLFIEPTARVLGL